MENVIERSCLSFRRRPVRGAQNSCQFHQSRQICGISSTAIASPPPMTKFILRRPPNAIKLLNFELFDLT